MFTPYITDIGRSLAQSARRQAQTGNWGVYAKDDNGTSVSFSALLRLNTR
ncbi:hypothetical protein [Klebsiella sp. BIGb0407]|nr:hypothetical protein [Klebsiella sp. BIGb0407]MCS3431119.1 hypothetical protein [Klebsiella sp. BIGb0407]